MVLCNFYNVANTSDGLASQAASTRVHLAQYRAWCAQCITTLLWCSIRVCGRGLSTCTDIYPCLMRLLARTPTFDPKCVIEITCHNPVDVVRPQEYNKYILITNGTDVALRCAGQP